MVSYQNYTVLTGVLFYILSKFLCYLVAHLQMHEKRHLSSIPENAENEEVLGTKWVPKKRHEVLKAKYKCLKKLFQIYDASVIGILPDAYKAEGFAPPEDVNQRLKRSRRTKTDASGCGDTLEASSGDATEHDGNSTVGSAALEDLNIHRSRSTQIMTNKTESTKFKDSDTQDSRETLNICQQECEGTQTVQTVKNFTPNIELQVPHLLFNEKRKPTRFQMFVSRIFGFKTQDDVVCASSDNNITHYRRRGLRCRRVRRSRKIRSEGVLSLRSPVILSFMQSVQRNCLMDTTTRQCPIVGCRMVTSGIINYNDHLNLCHFTDRIFICHYCHEGFENESDKCVHENEHIGLTKLNVSGTSSRQSAKRASVTQTEPQLGIQEEKLRKIVSFFDRMVYDDRVLAEIKKNRYSESNLRTLQRSSKLESNETTSNSIGDSTSDKRTVSCGHLPRRGCERDGGASELMDDGCTSVKCQLCGEQFDYRRQLSLHVDLEHRMHDKYSKFHSCAGIVNSNPKKTGATPSDDQTLCRVETSSTLTQDTFKVTECGYEATERRYKVPNESYKVPKTGYKVERRNSAGTLSCDPSTNIIYYESLEAVRKPSVIDNIVKRVRSGISGYKWEPGTKIIRV